MAYLAVLEKLQDSQPRARGLQAAGLQVVDVGHVGSPREDARFRYHIAFYCRGNTRIVPRMLILALPLLAAACDLTPQREVVTPKSAFAARSECFHGNKTL